MRKLWVATGVACALAAGALAQETDQTLPRPYTAEQIRDAWHTGAELVVRTTGPKGETRRRTTVTDWSPEGVTMKIESLDAAGASAGAPEEYKATWQELRDHAAFPAEKASRERAKRETPLGSLDGWLYVVNPGDGSVLEMFFADRYPGPPVASGQRKGETWLSKSEHLSWKPGAP
jgi:hypothetical protein